MIYRRGKPADGPALLPMIHAHATFERGEAVLPRDGLDDRKHPPKAVDAPY